MTTSPGPCGPAPPIDKGQDRECHERDYFKGTKENHERDGVHVSKVYRSVMDKYFKFNLCAPVRAGARFLEAIAVSMTTHPDLGILNLHSGPFMVTLVGPGDPSEPHHTDTGRLPDYLIVVHPALSKRKPPVEFKLPRNLQRAFARDCQENDLEPNPGAQPYKLDQYRDPVGTESPGYAADWLAAFAPVGRTGFVMIVQQRNE